MHEVNSIIDIFDIIDLATTNSFCFFQISNLAARRHSRRCGSDRIETEVRKARPADKAAKAPKAKGKNRSDLRDLELVRVGPISLGKQGLMPQDATRMFTHVNIMARASYC